MNRAERRKAGVKRTEPVYTVTRAQLAGVKKKAEEDAIEKLLVLMLGLPIMVLRDKYGFGTKRIDKFMTQLMDLFDSFNQGYISFDDIVTTIEKETGVKIEDYRRCVYGGEVL